MMQNQSAFNKALFCHSIKSYWWFFVFSFIGMFFAIPVPLLMKMNSLAKIQPYDALRWEREMDFWFSGRIPIHIIIIIGFYAVLLGISMFAFLHKKKNVNFIHSLPIKREENFFIRFLCGFFIFLGGYLINILAAALITTSLGHPEFIIWSAFLSQVGLGILLFILVYAIAIIAAMLTGTILSNLTGALILNFGFFLIYLSVSVIKQLFYGTFIFPDDGYMLSPFLYFVRHMVDSSFSMSGKDTVIFIAVAAVLVVLGLLLYKKRSSESATQTLSFSISRPIIKYPLMFILTCMMGALFYQLGQTGFMIFGFGAGVILANMFIEVTFNKDFKKMFRGVYGMLAFAVLFGIWTTAMHFDVFGFDNYVPKTGEIAKITFEYDAQESGYSGSRQHRGEFVFQSPESIEAIVNLAQKIVEEENYEKGAVAREYAQRSFQTLSITKYYTIEYKLKNARTVKRRYTNIDYDKIFEEFGRFYDTAENKAQRLPEWVKNMEFAAVTVDHTRKNHNKDTFSSEIRDKKNIQRILDAVDADMEKITFSDMTKPQKASLNFNMENAAGYYNLPINESFEKTIVVLKELGAYKEESYEDIKNLKVILLAGDETMDIWSLTNQIEKDPQRFRTIFFTDPDKIDAIMKATVHQAGRGWSGIYAKSDKRFLVMPDYQPQEYQRLYVLNENLIPSFLEGISN